VFRNSLTALACYLKLRMRQIILTPGFSKQITKAKIIHPKIVGFAGNAE